LFAGKWSAVVEVRGFPNENGHVECFAGIRLVAFVAEDYRERVGRPSNNAFMVMLKALNSRYIEE
jgi:hypothetical protein